MAKTRSKDYLGGVQLGFKLTEPLYGTLFKAVWVEFICMAFFIFFATGTAVFSCNIPDQLDAEGKCTLTMPRLLSIATAFGLAIGVLVYASAPFSGGHLNPAVTIAFAITRQISLLRAACYIAAQIGGGILGSVFVKWTNLVAFAAAGGAANKLDPTLPVSAGWLMEAILTGALIFVIFVATDQERGRSTAHVPVLAPFAIGFTVFVCHLVAIAIDGCSINPARSFATAVTSATWTRHGVFWYGPISGAVIIAIIYEVTFRPSSIPFLLPGVQEEAVELPEVVAKLPGYAGASGLVPDREAAHALAERNRGDSAQDEAHLPHGANGTHAVRGDAAV